MISSTWNFAIPIDSIACSLSFMYNYVYDLVVCVMICMMLNSYERKKYLLIINQTFDITTKTCEMNINGLVQDCGNSTPVELPQSCAKPSL